jgi:hypothetical protein
VYHFEPIFVFVLDKFNDIFEDFETRSIIKAYDKVFEIKSQYAMALLQQDQALKSLDRTTEADAAFAKSQGAGVYELVPADPED